MKLIHPAARRLLALSATTVAGLAAALVVANPASANPASATSDSVATAEASGTATCNQATGEWTVTWTVTNNFPAVATITALNVPGTGGPLTGFGVGSTIPAATGGDDDDEESVTSITGTQTFPGSVNQATLSGTAEWPNEATSAFNATVGKPLECTYKVEQTCDSIIFTFQPPPAAAAAVVTRTIKLTPSTGSPQTVTITSTDEPKVVTFPASDGLTVEVVIGENFKKTHAWSHDPCTPSPSPSLPTTGASLTGPFGIGAGLLVVGVALIAALFVFRRRRSVAGE